MNARDLSKTVSQRPFLTESSLTRWMETLQYCAVALLLVYVRFYVQYTGLGCPSAGKILAPNSTDIVERPPVYVRTYLRS